MLFTLIPPITRLVDNNLRLLHLENYRQSLLGHCAKKNLSDSYLRTPSFAGAVLLGGNPPVILINLKSSDQTMPGLWATSWPITEECNTQT